MGGKAFDNVGTIHKTEIKPTLFKIEFDTGVDATKVLGSVGKREYSGDIDIAVDLAEKDGFLKRLVDVYGNKNVRQIGAIVTTRVPIALYDKTKTARQPRTGYVQVDYMFGNIEWMRLYFHSPSTNESKLKGTHRNIAIAALTGYIDRQASDEVDDQMRPVELIRWKWSPKVGLVKVKRKSRKNKRTGTWIKKQDEEILSESVQDAQSIVGILFDGKVGVESLNSAESIVEAISVSKDAETAEEIYNQIARNFEDHTDVGPLHWEFPAEIKKYIGLKRTI